MIPIASDDSLHDLLSPEDDDFHPPTDHRWFHETSWWWFFEPERKLGGWIYNWIRPNIGTTGGGCWIWDDTGFLHYEVPYYACYANLELPEDRDLRDFSFPSGATQRVIEPLQTYRLGFRDRDIIDVDLTFDAVVPPWVVEAPGEPPTPHHLDQVGRVTGTLQLRGERVEIDCHAIRDRSWSPRSERWKDGHVGYCNAVNVDAEVGFLAMSASGARGELENRVRSGYFLKDGRRARVVDGTREVDRHPEHGHLRRIRIAAQDADGREFTAIGTGLNVMAMPIPGVHAIVWTCLVDWEIDGVRAWGEDQEAWAIHEWGTTRRLGAFDPVGDW